MTQNVCVLRIELEIGLTASCPKRISNKISIKEAFTIKNSAYLYSLHKLFLDYSGNRLSGPRLIRYDDLVPVGYLLTGFSVFQSGFPLRRSNRQSM